MSHEPGPGEILGQLDDLEKTLNTLIRTAPNLNLVQKSLSAGSVGLWQWFRGKPSIVIDENLAAILQVSAETSHESWSLLLGHEPAAKLEHELDVYISRSPKIPFKTSLIISANKKRRLKKLLCTASYSADNDLFYGLMIDIGLVDQDKKQSHLDATLKNIPIGVVTLNKHGQVLSVNPAFLRIFGIRSQENLVNEPVNSLDPIKHAGIEHHFISLWEKNIGFEFESPEIVNYQDERLYLHCRGFELPGSEAAYMILFSDITKRKNLEDQFSQSQRLESIGKLAGGIAHDFNNILTVIKGATSQVLRDMDDSSTQYQSIHQIHRAAERAESLTQQLLAFSRRQLMQPKIMDLNAYITGIGDALKSKVRDNIEIKTYLPADTGKIKADPHQVEQIINNLIFNANDAMPDGGVLSIETRNDMLDENYLQRRPLVKPGRYVMLAISDTGKGMDKDTQAHIFEPFFTTKEKGRGTGMGLSTVYGIIKQSNGYIWVYSELEKGTTIKLYFPFYEQPVEREEEKASKDQKLRGNETILVVDDEEEVRNLVSEMLRFYGYNVLEAPNAVNALLIFEKYNDTIDIVLSDIVMPQMNGVEMVEKIRTKSPKFKVIFMSGYTDNMVDQHALLDKEKNFLQKPFNALTLVGKIREILDL